MHPRTRLLLEGPIALTLLRLAAPNVVTTVVQASTGLIEAYFIGFLGTDALAGVALVFPGVMLMQMMSSGAMGGGVSSSIARALGSGRKADADAIVMHAIVIAAALAAIFMLTLLPFGRPLYAAMGGTGASLDAALTYSDIVFAGAILIWLFNTLANVIRGSGNTFVPAAVTAGGAALLIPLSAALIFGFGPLPRLEVAGGAIALLTYYGAGTLAFAAYLLSGRSAVRPRPFATRLRRSLFYDIVRVGAVASLIALMTNITIAATVGLVGAYGPAAIAGYGVGTRLEYLLIPLTFGFGGALVSIVGTNIGAGRLDRAQRAAWIGGWICFALTGGVGIAAALWPSAWLTLFGSDPAMIAAGTAYLQVVAPFYGFFGLGMALYFASQGAGALTWPLIAGAARLSIAVGGGWLLLSWGADLKLMFAAPALALAAFGIIVALAVARGAWRASHDKRSRSG